MDATSTNDPPNADFFSLEPSTHSLAKADAVPIVYHNTASTTSIIIAMEKPSESAAQTEAPVAKRVRTNEDEGSHTTNEDAELPLILQLAIPFLPSGDLGDLTSVNRACRCAAIASYHKRLESPNVLKHPLVHKLAEF